VGNYTKNLVLDDRLLCHLGHYAFRILHVRIVCQVGGAVVA